MATFVMVHGAFSGGWQWREVARLLRDRGHEVITPSLTGHGERIHLATSETGLKTHVEDICNVLRYEDLHAVILVCQSYGGMVVSGVADRMPERLAHLVYLNALVPEDGQAAVDLLPTGMRQHFEAGARTVGDGSRVPAPPLEDDPRVAAFARGRFVPSPLRMFTDPLRLGPPPDVRRTFIWCTEDPAGLAGVADLMQPFAKRARDDPAWQFRQLTAPPDAVIYMPRALADLLDEAASAG